MKFCWSESVKTENHAIPTEPMMTATPAQKHIQFNRLCTLWPNSTSFLSAMKLLVLRSRCLLPAQSCHATVTQSSLGINPLTPHRPLAPAPTPTTHTHISLCLCLLSLVFRGCVVISAAALSLASPPATAAASGASRHSSEGHQSGQLSPGTHHFRAVSRPRAPRPPRDPALHPRTPSNPASHNF